MMRWLRWVAVFVCLQSFWCFGQREDWLPVTAQDWQVKDVPGDPGAPAIQLYYADARDDSRQYQFIYRRIKILNDKGQQYADVAIPLPPYAHFMDLRARIVHPDGRITEFSGKPFEKIASQTPDAKAVIETFTLPEATPGCIIEYKYRYTWDTYIVGKTWDLQHDLYTVREVFSIRPFTGPLNGTKHFEDEAQLSYVYSNLPEGVKPKQTGAVVELEAARVPAFAPEDSMPPQDNFRPRVRFFYGGREIDSPESFWREHGRDWFAEAERFIGNHQQIRNAAAEAVGEEKGSEQKLRKLYARAQQLRNLSFERVRTREEDKAEDLKANRSALDVLDRGYGTAYDIALFFVALARAAGFDADLLRASSRKDHVFDRNFLSAEQLETGLVVVKLNGAEIFLDPGTRFCPFGLVYWTHSSVPALKLAQNGGTFVAVPTASADKTVSRRSVTAVLGSDGSLQGEIALELEGMTALQLRLDALQKDNAGRLSALGEALGDWRTQPGSVKLQSAEGWELSEGPLLAHFTFELPGLARKSGKRLLVPATVFQMRERTAFEHAERKYPIYFPYTFEEIDKVDIQAPDGFSVETLPAGQDVKLASTRFVTTRASQVGHVNVTRALVVNSVYFPVENYRDLKQFFDKLGAADEEQIVLREGKARSAPR
ncbi:MAG TPA: DUF3857 domain-containing protein [Verrucomicrobiae bacterium]|jgi:hypothetical protein|nr:DUF3857 domain-containing protein [Verrucomicrobiae bacterium]